MVKSRNNKNYSHYSEREQLISGKIKELKVILATESDQEKTKKLESEIAFLNEQLNGAKTVRLRNYRNRKSIKTFRG